jgi:hypothetical protein
MKLIARFRPPAMVGTPPSARQIPAHPELHALDFAQRYAERSEGAACLDGKRMEMALTPSSVIR